MIGGSWVKVPSEQEQECYRRLKHVCQNHRFVFSDAFFLCPYLNALLTFLLNIFRQSITTPATVIIAQS